MSSHEVHPFSSFNDLVGHREAIELVPAFGALFWPAFVSVRGCVLLRDRYEENNFDQWWNELSGRRGDIERVLNHLHLWDLFESRDEISDQMLEELAEVLAKVWRCALAEQFPDRRFEVSVASGVDEYGPTLSFRSTSDLLPRQTGP